MEKAKNLSEVIRLFDPRQPLKGETLAFYIDRPGNPLQKMETYLQSVAGAGTPVKVLFTGHVGSGKSTELNKVSQRLDEKFFIVRLDVQEDLNLADLEAVDILLGLFSSLVRCATDEKVLRQAPAQIAANVWENVRDFFSRAVMGESISPPLPVETEVAVSVNLLAVQFRSKFSQEKSTRETARRQMQGREAELVEKLNFIVRQVRDHYKKRPVLFMIEGTDKPILPKARDLFLNYARTLTAFEAAAIYTFPIGLRYSSDFAQIKDSFNLHYILPNIKVERRDGTPEPDGPDYLASAVTRRARQNLFEENALHTILDNSGGLMRTLVRMVQRAAVNALSYGRQQLTGPDAEVALQEDRSDFIAALKASDYEVLAARMADHLLSSDAVVQEMLQCQALLEYANGEPWCNVHPVIRGLVHERVTGG